MPTEAPPPPSPWTTAPGDLPGGPRLEEEYRAPVEAYLHAKSPRAASTLLTAVRPILDEAVRSYGGGEGDSPVVRAHAKRLALEAVDRYDPERARLRTHLLSHLRGLRRIAERSAAGVRVPEQWRIDAQRVGAFATDLRDELGREPSDAEVAARSSVPIERVRRSRSAPGVLADSQVEGSIPLQGRNEKVWNQWVDGVYHDLNPVDQVILDHSFGLHKKPVVEAAQIARMVNLSPGAVSHRKAKIQQQLDEFESFFGRPG